MSTAATTSVSPSAASCRKAGRCESRAIAPAPTTAARMRRPSSGPGGGVVGDMGVISTPPTYGRGPGGSGKRAGGARHRRYPCGGGTRAPAAPVHSKRFPVGSNVCGGRATGQPSVRRDLRPGRPGNTAGQPRAPRPGATRRAIGSTAPAPDERLGGVPRRPGPAPGVRLASGAGRPLLKPLCGTRLTGPLPFLCTPLIFGRGRLPSPPPLSDRHLDSVTSCLGLNPSSSDSSRG